MNMQPTAKSMSKAYDEVFDRVLKDVGGWVPRQRPKMPKLVSCWPARGDRFTPGRSVLVVGRALNGFELELEFSIEEVQSETSRKGVAGRARAFAECPNGGSPLSWVWGKWRPRYGSVGTRSAFWRVTRALVRLVEGQEAAAAEDWASYVAWTNLAKVAPARGGNPPPRLFEKQYAACIEALRQELLELNPGIVLFIAGEDLYLDAYNRLYKHEPSKRDGAKYVRHVSREASQLWLCTERPERRPETKFRDELVAAYEEVSNDQS